MDRTKIKAEKTPSREKTPRSSRTSTLAKGLSMAKMMDRVQATLKNLIEIGLLEDLTILVKAISENKDNVVTFIEKGTSLAFEGNQLLADNKEQLASLIVKGEQSLSTLNEAIVPLVHDLSDITGVIAQNSGRITSILAKADELLDEKEAIRKLLNTPVMEDLAVVTGELARNAGRITSILAKADELLDEKEAIRKLLNTPVMDDLAVVTGELARNSGRISSTLSKADELLDEKDRIKDLIGDAKAMTQAMTPQVGALAAGLPGFADGLRFIHRSLSNLLPRLENINERSLEDFMLRKGIRVFLKAFPKL